MALALVLVWAAVAARVFVTLRGPVTVWRWSFTVAILGVAVGSTAHAAAAPINAAITPSAASLITHQSTLVAGGAVLVYLAHLVLDSPPRRLIRGILAVTATAILVQQVTWRPWPVLTLHEGDMALVAGSQLYTLSYHLSLMTVNALAAFLAGRFLLDRQRTGNGSRAGLLLVCVSAALATVGMASFAARTILRATTGTDHLWLRSVGDGVAPAAIGGFALGTIIFLVVPWARTQAEAWATVRELEPLWSRLVDEHPRIASGRAEMLLTGPRFRAERMAVEIHDALRLVRVSPVGPDPYVRIVSALQHPPAIGSPAHQVLPTAADPAEDRAVLLDLARTYRRTRHAP